MREIQGFFDGNTVQFAGPVPKRKQVVLVKFFDESAKEDCLPVGILSKYANPKLREKEASAFEEAMVEKHGNR